MKIKILLPLSESIAGEHTCENERKYGTLTSILSLGEGEEVNRGMAHAYFVGAGLLTERQVLSLR